MNYLAHAALAEPSDDARLGSILGDFQRGLDETLFTEATRWAIAEHRAVDAWFDAHPAVRAARTTFPLHLGRFAGVLIDVFVDHCLHRQWDEHHAGTGLEEVSASLYRGLRAHAAALPPRLARIAPSIVGDDWLGGYGSLDNIERALHGIASRLKRPTPLAEGAAVLRQRPGDFDELTRTVYPEVQAWVRARRRDAGG